MKIQASLKNAVNNRCFRNTNLLMLHYNQSLKIEREQRERRRAKCQSNIVNPCTTKPNDTFHNTHNKLKYLVKYTSSSWSSMNIRNNLLQLEKIINIDNC
jgi:hypothetical protein